MAPATRRGKPPGLACVSVRAPQGSPWQKKIDPWTRRSTRAAVGAQIWTRYARTRQPSPPRSGDVQGSTDVRATQRRGGGETELAIGRARRGDDVQTWRPRWRPWSSLPETWRVSRRMSFVGGRCELRARHGAGAGGSPAGPAELTEERAKLVLLLGCQGCSLARKRAAQGCNGERWLQAVRQ